MSNPSNTEIDNIVDQLKDCRIRLESIKDSLCSPVYDKVRKEIGYAICDCHRANKELDEIRPLEGQISFFDLDDFER